VVFSVVDICGALTDSSDSGSYWRKLKQRFKQEKSEVVTICHGLKLEAPDGKTCKTVRSENEHYKFYCIFASKYAAIQL
jgi:hypothetical protein